jgi:hypothetical protein
MSITESPPELTNPKIGTAEIEEFRDLEIQGLEKERRLIS